MNFISRHEKNQSNTRMNFISRHEKNRSKYTYELYITS